MLVVSGVCGLCVWGAGGACCACVVTCCVEVVRLVELCVLAVVCSTGWATYDATYGAEVVVMCVRIVSVAASAMLVGVHAGKHSVLAADGCTL